MHMPLFSQATIDVPAGPPSRDQIAEKYKWQLSDIFSDDAAFEAAFARVEGMVAAFPSLRGTLGKGADELLTALRQRDELWELLDRVAVYAGLRYHEDMSIAAAQGRHDRVQTLSTRASEATSWFMPELLALPWETLVAWMSGQGELAVYRHMLDDIFREKQHVLSPREEELLAMAGEVAAAPGNIYSRFTNTDLDFPVIRDEEDRELKLSQAAYSRLIYSPDRRVRRDAFLGLHRTYDAKKGTLATMLSAHVKQHIFGARARRYEGCLKAALSRPNIPVEVYRNLIDTVGRNAERLHAYVAMRKRLMKLDEIHGYDLYVPMIERPAERIAYDDAAATILEALRPMGEDYVATLRTAFSSRWIDVYETKNKRSGAYCWGSYSTHPYLLLNYGGTANDRSTIAHELGHAMHSWYTTRTQPLVYGDYATFCAEVASTVNEVLLAHHLLERAADLDERLLILQQEIEEIRTTVFRQTMFAEFELLIHDMAERGEPLTSDVLCEAYERLVRKYYGPLLVLEPEARAECLRIPHFYRNFYVFTYATSHCAAIDIGRRIIAGEPGAVEGMMRFLSAGSSLYPLDVLRLAGVDMSTPRPIERAMEHFSGLLATFERMYGERRA